MHQQSLPYDAGVNGGYNAPAYGTEARPAAGFADFSAGLGFSAGSAAGAPPATPGFGAPPAATGYAIGYGDAPIPGHGAPPTSGFSNAPTSGFSNAPTSGFSNGPASGYGVSGYSAAAAAPESTMFDAENKRMLDATRRSMAIIAAKRKAEAEGVPYSDGGGGGGDAGGQWGGEQPTKKKKGPTLKNTSVYVSGLPRDVTELELTATFGKIGALRKTKVYRLPSGEAKGDALITYDLSAG